MRWSKQLAGQLSRGDGEGVILLVEGRVEKWKVVMVSLYGG